ncbi:MAG TPA: hypothetical protein VIM71_09350 [Lacunisphaera sp.]
MSSSAHTDFAAASQADLRTENFLEPRLVELYRAATPEKKLAMVAQLNRTLQGLKAVQLAADRPELSDEQRRIELRRWWLADWD